MNKNQLKQFIIAKICAKQGFSVNVKGQGTRNGYMVGFNEAELVKDVTEITGGDIDRWVDDNYLTIAEDKNLYAGGWLDGDTYYLEISRNIGIESAAIDFAKKHNQKAIFDCEAQEVVTVKYEHFATNQLNELFGHFGNIFSPKQ